MEKKRNLWIISTDKPSRLWKNWESKLMLHHTFTDILLNKQHIYITSDEVIKEGDWFFEPINNSILKLEDKADKLIKSIFPTCKKILLTTDRDLINGGIQSIDNEFSEWFVKNPSCEWVEVVDGLYFDDVEWISCYKIIIPKEEPKQGTFEEDAKDFVENTMKFSFTSIDTRTQANRMLKCVEFGAKWQQEQNKNLYSEKDLKEAYNANENGWIGFDFWFEQFKKK